MSVKAIKVQNYEKSYILYCPYLILGEGFIMRKLFFLSINILIIVMFISAIIMFPKIVGATEVWQQTYGGVSSP